MASPVITPEDVLETLMNDGTIDAIRLKIINQLKAKEELKSNTIKMVEQSKVLNTPGAEKQTKRELFDSLRQELEAPALEKASRSVWDLILDQDGLGKEINDTVERVFCQLSGCEPPLFPTSSCEAQPAKEKEVSPSSSKKRSFNDISKEEENGVKQESGNGPAMPENVMKVPSPNSRK
ncbi:antigenic heat-stable protein [Perilla frutescens var. frutescens]|nr:antigenic heat-stable protein [Perilla frutescens var. frutescens]